MTKRSSSQNGKLPFLTDQDFEDEAALLLAKFGHQRGHRKVTNGNQTRWLTPAGLCVSTRKFGAFSSSQTLLVSKPRDAVDTHRHPKRLKSGPKAQNHGTTPKHVPCSKTLQFAAQLRFRAAVRFLRTTPETAPKFKTAR